MNMFYQKLNEFGTMINITSHSKQIDMADYFIVMHPAHPIVKNIDQTRPGIRFNDGYPWAVKREIVTLWKKVFGA